MHGVKSRFFINNHKAGGIFEKYFSILVFIFTYVGDTNFESFCSVNIIISCQVMCLRGFFGNKNKIS